MAPQSQKRPTTQRPACRWQSALQRCRSSWLKSYEDKSIGFYLPLSSTLLPDSLPFVTLAAIFSSTFILSLWPSWPVFVTAATPRRSPKTANVRIKSTTLDRITKWCWQFTHKHLVALCGLAGAHEYILKIAASL